MRLKVEGVDDILKALEKADKEVQKALHDLIAEAAEIVFQEADANVPIKTGASRESIRIEIGTTKRGNFFANVLVGDNQAYYVPFNELGTSRQPPRPVMRPALDRSRTAIRNHIIDGLREAIARQGK